MRTIPNSEKPRRALYWPDPPSGVIGQDVLGASSACGLAALFLDLPLNPLLHPFFIDIGRRDPVSPVGVDRRLHTQPVFVCRPRETLLFEVSSLSHRFIHCPLQFKAPGLFSFLRNSRTGPNERVRSRLHRGRAQFQLWEWCSQFMRTGRAFGSERHGRATSSGASGQEVRISACHRPHDTQSDSNFRRHRRSL